jgi:hypothetical protein
MSAPHDIAFGGAAVKQRMLTSEQVNLGAKAQKVLYEPGIPKSLAVIAVEAGWMELNAALTIVTGLRKLGVDHPEVKPREASDADDSVLDRLSPNARKRLESASRTLASLFFARGAGTLALDQGSPAAAAGRAPRKPGDPTPTPVPGRRLKPPVIETVVPPPPKSGALGAIVACVAALAAIIGLLIVKKSRTPVPEPEPPPIAAKHAPPPPKAPPPPPPKAPVPPPTDDDPSVATPKDPVTDSAVEEKRKQYIEEQEKEAAKRLDEIKKLLAEGRPASARGKLKRLKEEFGWTEFVKSHTDEIARLANDAEGDSGAPTMPSDPADPGPEPVAEGPALPGMAAALKRLDDGASADARRAVAAMKALAGAKSDLVLRGVKVVKAAEVVDVSREDLRVRGDRRDESRPAPVFRARRLVLPRDPETDLEGGGAGGLLRTRPGVHPAAPLEGGEGGLRRMREVRRGVEAAASGRRRRAGGSRDPAQRAEIGRWATARRLLVCRPGAGGGIRSGRRVGRRRLDHWPIHQVLVQAGRLVEFEGSRLRG